MNIRTNVVKRSWLVELADRKTGEVVSQRVIAAETEEQARLSAETEELAVATVKECVV
jgi:hypothetical protein